MGAVREPQFRRRQAAPRLGGLEPGGAGAGPGHAGDPLAAARRAWPGLRLWSAKASEEIDLGAFNRGNYFAAVEGKNHSENVSRVLYPDDSTPSGRELRLRQEHFFVSASVQDLLRRYTEGHADFSQLAAKVSIHLNDTHPVLAIPELMHK